MEFICELLVQPISNYNRSHDDFRAWLEMEAIRHNLGELITCRVVKESVRNTTIAFVCFRKLQSNRIAMELFHKQSTFDKRELSWSVSRTCEVPVMTGLVRELNTRDSTSQTTVLAHSAGVQCGLGDDALASVLRQRERERIRHDRNRSASIKRKIEWTQAISFYCYYYYYY